MSVVKSKRSQSKIEFEMIYFQVVDGVDNLVENQFYTDAETIQKNRWFVNARFQTLQKLTDDLLYNIKIANSIYPTCMAELEERRVLMGKAIGVCYAILTHLSRIMMRLRIPDNKYTNDIGNIARMINSLKAFRRIADTGQMSEGDIYNCYQSWRGATVKDHNAWYKSIGSTDSFYMMLFPIHEEKVHKSRRQLVAEIFSTLDREDFKYIV